MQYQNSNWTSSAKLQCQITIAKQRHQHRWMTLCVQATCPWPTWPHNQDGCSPMSWGLSISSHLQYYDCSKVLHSVIAVTWQTHISPELPRYKHVRIMYMFIAVLSNYLKTRNRNGHVPHMAKLICSEYGSRVVAHILETSNVDW